MGRMARQRRKWRDYRGTREIPLFENHDYATRLGGELFRPGRLQLASEQP